MKKLYYDPPKHRISLVVVFPKSEFRAWRKNLVSKHHIYGYSATEDLVLMIPWLGLLDTSERIDDFINALKPEIVRLMFQRISRIESEWPGPATGEVCDNFFDLVIRDTPVDGLTKSLREEFFDGWQ